MPSMFFIKFYHEVLHDPKMGRLPDRLWRRFFELCLMAGEQQDGGNVPNAEDMAWTLHMDEGELMQDLEAMAAIGLISPNENGTWFVTNFAKRQARIPGAERVARYREQQRKDTYYGNEPSNDSLPVACNEPVTTRYTEVELEEDIDPEGDTDTDKREQVAPPANGSPEKRASKPKAKDPAPVAVEKFREVTLRYPNKALWSDIQTVIGSDEKELARWQRTVKAWIAMGWNPTNVKGMLQHFRDKRIPGDDMKSRGSPGGIPEPAGYAALRALAQEEGWEGFDTTWQH